MLQLNNAKYQITLSRLHCSVDGTGRVIQFELYSPFNRVLSARGRGVGGGIAWVWSWG